jgi:hypothetical protein
LVNPFLNTTNTLLAPHLNAEVAQSKAVSPAPSTITLPKIYKFFSEKQATEAKWLKRLGRIDTEHVRWRLNSCTGGGRHQVTLHTTNFRSAVLFHQKRKIVDDYDQTYCRRWNVRLQKQSFRLKKQGSSI